MTTTRRTFLSSLAGAGAVSASALIARVAAQGDSHGGHQHGATEPSPEAECATPESTPGMDHHGGHGDMGTPAASMEYDQAYIDMMIPHHESVIALAEVAKDQVSDERLVTIAEAILAAQPAEIEELKALREEWYGDPEPAAMSDEMMAVSMGMDHDDCAGEGHMTLMNAESVVAEFEAAEDKDLAFIGLVIPHHQMAIDVSEVALERAEHQELKDIAERVIGAQQAEIDELEAIRAELTATPTA